MLILASASPRRRLLMSMVDLKYECIPSHVDEVIPEGMSVQEIPEYLSCMKAADVFKTHPDATVIGSDTLVEIDGRILGKPKDEAEAFHMLKALSGKKHRVYTGVTILKKDIKDSFTSVAEVEFYELTDAEIKEYIATGDPMDKAGSYGIQGIGAPLIKGITGDFYTVMGLPVAELVRHLRKTQEL